MGVIVMSAVVLLSNKGNVDELSMKEMSVPRDRAKH